MHTEWAKVAEFHDPEVSQRRKIDTFIQNLLKILETWEDSEVIDL